MVHWNEIVCSFLVCIILYTYHIKIVSNYIVIFISFCFYVLFISRRFLPISTWLPHTNITIVHRFFMTHNTVSIGKNKFSYFKKKKYKAHTHLHKSSNGTLTRHTISNLHVFIQIKNWCFLNANNDNNKNEDFIN